MSRNRSYTPRGYTRLSSSLIAGALTVAGPGGVLLHPPPLMGPAPTRPGDNDDEGKQWHTRWSRDTPTPIGGDTEGTVIGAAAGAGLGYIIGNESDKAREPRYRVRPDD